MEKKLILVVDVPTTATVEQAEAILNAPFADGYYLEHLHAKGDQSARAYFKLRTRTAARPELGKDAPELALLRAHPKASVRAMALILKAHGYDRNKDWVAAQRKAMAASAGSEA